MTREIETGGTMRERINQLAQGIIDKDVKEVFALALTNEKVADAIDLSVKVEKTEKKAE